MSKKYNIKFKTSGAVNSEYYHVENLVIEEIISDDVDESFFIDILSPSQLDVVGERIGRPRQNLEEDAWYRLRLKSNLLNKKREKEIGKN